MEKNMENQIEVLISTMNLWNRQQCEAFIRQMNLATPSLIINQTKKLEMKTVEQIGNHRIFSYQDEIRFKQKQK